MQRALKDFLPPEIATRRTKAPAMRCSCFRQTWEIIDKRVSFTNALSLAAAAGGAMYSTRHEKRTGPRFFLRLLKALSLELWLRDVIGTVLSLFPEALPSPSWL